MTPRRQDPLSKARRLRPIGKTEFERAAEALRTELLTVQYELRDRDFAVVVLLAGEDRESVPDVAVRLSEWLDARLIDWNTRARTTEEERERPYLWRFWSRLPRTGRIGVFPLAWAEDLLQARVKKKYKKREHVAAAATIARFERELFDAGTLVVKLWFHLDAAELRRRRREEKHDPLAAWEPEPRHANVWRKLEQDDDAERDVLRDTHAPHAPWHVVWSADRHARDLAVGRILRDALAKRLKSRPHAHSAPVESGRIPDRLANVDFTRHLPPARYKPQLSAAQGRLNRLTRRAYRAGISTVVVLEGPDAAGKGGAIRRMTRGIRAPIWKAVPIGPPSEEERAHHWLWRFWRELPAAGHVTVFDRSWHERVLVERVEKFATPAEWRRAYDEIVDFERQLVDAGVVLVKFWLEVSPDEQERRFDARGRVPFKKYKLTPDDFRNRAKRPAYRAAANEMFARTDWKRAPWKIVPADDKPLARVMIVEAVADAIEDAL